MSCVSGYYRRGRIKNFLRRTVVLRKRECFCIPEITFELCKVCKISASPTVDALGKISNNAYVFMFVGEHFGKQVLRVVCVLIFINQYVAKTILIFLKHMRVLFKKRDSFY